MKYLFSKTISIEAYIHAMKAALFTFLLKSLGNQLDINRELVLA